VGGGSACRGIQQNGENRVREREGREGMITSSKGQTFTKSNLEKERFVTSESAS